MRAGLILLGVAVVAAIALLFWFNRPHPVRESTPADPVARSFIARYVDATGRIADTANGGVSHSEGQGYGLLLAEGAADRAAFDRILSWTDANLRTREDGLYAWLWKPELKSVADPNNASDGDILIAWALLRADDRWNVSAYRERAHEILDAVESTVIRDSSRGKVILPGVDGFERADGVVVNLSYWVFPAFERFAKDGRSVWSDVGKSGLALTEAGQFGRHGLASDWMVIGADGSLAPADGWPPEFGYNAVRLPLHLCWSGLESDARTAALERYRAFWAAHEPRASDKWNVETDLAAGGLAPPAYDAIAALVGACLGDPGEASISLETDEAYFSAALKGLVSLARRDRDLARRVSSPSG